MQKNYLVVREPEERWPECINSYLFLVMEVLSLAKKTGRVLVLPHIIGQPRDNVRIEAGETGLDKTILGTKFYPLESIFDTDKLSECVEVIPFGDFLKISERKLSCLCCFGQLHTGGSIEVYGEKFFFKQALRVRGIKEVEANQSLSLCITAYRRGTYMVKNSPNWHNDPRMDYWGIRKCFKYREDLIKRADEFIERNLGEKYLAVHWRRGDRLIYGMVEEDLMIAIPGKQDAMGRELAQFARLISSYLKKRNLKKVFLATDCGTKWHIDYLKGLLPIVRYPASGNWEDLLYESVIEQIICIKSDFFLAAPYRYTRCSSFSRWIIDERKLIGKGQDVAFSPRRRMKLTKQISLFVVPAARIAIWRLRNLVKKLLCLT